MFLLFCSICGWLISCDGLHVWVGLYWWFFVIVGFVWWWSLWLVYWLDFVGVLCLVAYFSLLLMLGLLIVVCYLCGFYCLIVLFLSVLLIWCFYWLIDMLLGGLVIFIAGFSLLVLNCDVVCFGIGLAVWIGVFALFDVWVGCLFIADCLFWVGFVVLLCLICFGLLWVSGYLICLVWLLGDWFRLIVDYCWVFVWIVNSVALLFLVLLYLYLLWFGGFWVLFGVFDSAVFIICFYLDGDSHWFSWSWIVFTCWFCLLSVLVGVCGWCCLLCCLFGLQICSCIVRSWFFVVWYYAVTVEGFVAVFYCLV